MCARASGKGVRLVSRVPLGGAGGQGPHPRGPCPAVPSLALPGARAAAGVPGGRSGSAGFGGRRGPAGLGTWESGLGGGGTAPSQGGAALYRSARGMPSAGRGRRGAEGPGPTVRPMGGGTRSAPPAQILVTHSKPAALGWAARAARGRAEGWIRERRTEGRTGDLQRHRVSGTEGRL